MPVIFVKKQGEVQLDLPLSEVPKKNPVMPPEELYKKIDEFSRVRLSKNFIMRDFLFTAYGSAHGLHNYPMDNVAQVIKAGKELCSKVLEPILEKFGRFSITFGYQNRLQMEYEMKQPIKRHSSSPHHWDRGTYGQRVYARVDILPFCVEDGEVSKEDFAEWCMMNLDIDLFMQWDKSNVCCITISPSPRRVWLKWVKWGAGDNGSNKIDYWGVDFWTKVFPSLPNSKKPKYHPSHTKGAMW